MIKQEKRIEVISEFFVTTHFIENVINDFIADKIGIEYSEDSEMFGKNKFALSYDQKIEFLLETENFSIIDKSKLSAFRGIRNEFLKFGSANSLEESFNSVDNNADFLLILYPQDTFLPRNEKLTVALYNLINDVKELVTTLTGKTNKDKSNISFLRKRMNAPYLNKVFTMLFSLILLK
ncbi:MAG: hypothetical protein ABFR05_11190 [Bacteroidota bacterium]